MQVNDIGVDIMRIEAYKFGSRIMGIFRAPKADPVDTENTQNRMLPLRGKVHNIAERGRPIFKAGLKTCAKLSPPRYLLCLSPKCFVDSMPRSVSEE